MKLLRPHWYYLNHLLLHKRLVFQEARRLGLPLWIALFHDWSKFLPSEWFPYVAYFFPNGDVQDGAMEAFYYSCELHYQRNKHHWNHWVVDGVAQEMPARYRLEMLADWWAVARALGNESPLAWYTMMQHEGRMNLHPETKAWVDKELGYGATETHTDCRSETGITVGIVDSLITLCRVLVTHDLSASEVQEALKDLRSDEDVRKVFNGEI